MGIQEIINCVIILANFSIIYFGYWAISQFIVRLNNRIKALEDEIKENKSINRIICLNHMYAVRKTLIRQELYEQVDKVDKLIKELEKMITDSERLSF